MPKEVSPNQPMTTTEIIASLATRLDALEQFVAKIEEANILRNKTLDLHLNIIENLERRLAKIEKATPGEAGEWVHPSANVDYVDIIEGAGFSGGADG